MRTLRLSDLKALIKEDDAEIVVFLAASAWFIYKLNQEGWDPVELVLVLGFIFSGLIYFIYDAYKLITREAGVLVCSLGDSPALVEEIKGDAYIHRGHFPAVELCQASKLGGLLASLSSGDFRILHILSEFSGDGMLIEAQGTRADVTPLFELCRKKKLLFVYFGGNIPDEHRDAVFERIGSARVRHDFPVVMTMDRGTGFGSFLDRLLREIGMGRSLGEAWLRLRPQDAGPGVPQPTVDSGPNALLLL